MARNAASEAALFVSPNVLPRCSASASGTAGNVGVIIAPLSPIAPAISPFASGEAMIALTDTDPADSPAIVTLDGSPPKEAMLLRTQTSSGLHRRTPFGAAPYTFRNSRFRILPVPVFGKLSTKSTD